MIASAWFHTIEDIYDLVERVGRTRRDDQTARWRMSTETFQRIARIPADGRASTTFWLCGYPVDIDEGVPAPVMRLEIRPRYVVEGVL